MSKVIVITGAGVGLGRTLARQFVADGHRVVLLGRTQAKVDAVAEELGENALAVPCDVGSVSSVNTAFEVVAERFTNVDVLINNAAVFEPFKLADASDDQILGAVATNLTGPMLCARSAIPLMKPGAHIINITSESVDVPFPHLAVYQSTKAGIERLSKSLFQELEPDGIRVSTVRAGSMYEEGKSWNVDPQAAMAFGEAAARRGIHLREKPLTQFTSVTGVFTLLINLPADLAIDHISLKARKPS